jgi:hypothetical protein
MKRAGMFFGIGAVFALVFGICNATFAQEFPYAVPQAPEFDTGSSMLPPAPVEETAPETKPAQPQSSHRKRSRSSGEPKIDYRTVRPYVPQEAPPPASSYPQSPQPPQPSPAAPTQMGHPAVASTPPGQPPQMQHQLDCSKFPMLIAQSRSEQEMQWQARLYLTCLVRSGWNEEQAKQQVISTIESTFRLAR